MSEALQQTIDEAWERRDELGAARPGPPSLPGSVPGTTTEKLGTRPVKIWPLARSTMRVDALMKTPIDRTQPSSTTTPSTTSERAPMKQLSSMMVGLAWSGSSTPPIPAPADTCTLRPTCAQLPIEAHVSTIAPCPR